MSVLVGESAFFLSSERFIVLPCFPGSLSGVPEVVEFFVVAEHIHGFPEPCMLVGMHFSVGSQVLQRLLFKGYVIPTGRNIVEHFRFANEESYVNPSAVTIRFFMEGIYPSVGRVNVDSSKFSFRFEYRHRDGGPFFAVHINGFCDVDIAYSVPVGEAEGFVAYVGFYAFDASTCQGG